MKIFVGVMLLMMLVACTLEQQAQPLTASDLAAPPAALKTTTNKTTTTTRTTQPAAVATGNATIVSAVVTQNNQELLCLDTDYGDEKDVKGTVQVTLPNQTIIKTDECLGGSLREWYCDKGDLTKKVYDCNNGCADGACKP